MKAFEFVHRLGASKICFSRSTRIKRSEIEKFEEELREKSVEVEWVALRFGRDQARSIAAVRTSQRYSASARAGLGKSPLLFALTFASIFRIRRFWESGFDTPHETGAPVVPCTNMMKLRTSSWITFRSMVLSKLIFCSAVLSVAAIPVPHSSFAADKIALCDGPTCLPARDEKNCTQLPSRCGYPDGTNTGPVRGTIFRRVPQDVSSGAGWEWEPNFERLRVTGPGVIIEDVEVHGQVVIDAPNVTLRNSKIVACGVDAIVAIRAGRPADGYNADGALVERNLLSCDGPADQRASRGVSDVYGLARRLVILRNNIWNVSNGVTVEREGLVQFNFVHDLGHMPNDHHSGLSNHGGADDVVFDFNTVLLSQEGVSGAITIYSDFAAARNVTISRNLVSGGSYCIYGGESGAFVPSQGSIRISHNRFSKIDGQRGNCGLYGQVAAFAPTRRSDWTGNVWDENLRPVPEPF